MSNSKDRVFIIYLADVDVELFFVLETMHTYQENYFGSSLFANKDLKLIFEKCIDLRQFRKILAKTFLRSLRPKENNESKTGTL